MPPKRRRPARPPPPATPPSDENDELAKALEASNSEFAEEERRRQQQEEDDLQAAIRASLGQAPPPSAAPQEESSENEAANQTAVSSPAEESSENVDPNPEISVPEPVSFEDVVADEEVATSDLAPPTFLIPDQTSTPINLNTNRIKDEPPSATESDHDYVPSPQPQPARGGRRNARKGRVPQRRPPIAYDDSDQETSLDASNMEEFANSFLQDGPTLTTVRKEDAANSNFANQFAEVENHFLSKMIVKPSSKDKVVVQSMVMSRGQSFQAPYERKKESNIVLNIPDDEVIVYYNQYRGNSKNVLWKIVERHLKPFRNHGGRNDHGKGVYLQERPDVEKALKTGIVACKLLPGNKFIADETLFHADPPKGHHSKYIKIDGNPTYVVQNPDQVLPLAVIHCVKVSRNAPSTSRAGPSLPNLAADAAERIQEDNDRVTDQMNRLFENSLKLHATGKYMQAAEALVTPLYPHQMYGLHWMASRENLEGHGMKGGILADDMGLGKTLTVISLIMSNFHDGKPLAKPLFGHQRMMSKSAAKYMPQNLLKRADVSGLGKRLKESKDKKGTVKKSAQSGYDSLDDFDIDNYGDNDEFDSMVSQDDSFSKRLGLNSSEELFKPRKRNFFDDLSDDDEYQNMTEAERNEKMAPKFDQLDGNVTDISSDDDEGISPSAKSKKKKTRRILSDDEDDSDTDKENKQKAKKPKLQIKETEKSAVVEDEYSEGILSFDEDDIPDPEDAPKGEPEKPKHVRKERQEQSQLTEEQKKNLVIPPRMPAKTQGRRRATLIITPASLISHWLAQIEEHVDKGVDLNIMVHHGTSKSMLGKELEDQDIVLTTYGTLQAELHESKEEAFSISKQGALLRAKWLRVVLDEGHYIKNHLSKTHKAAAYLNTKRKWIVSGTPIQNNLKELWSLLTWLDEPNYGDAYKQFKRDIEDPVKHGDTRGVIRLQILVEAVCLRRTKQDKVDGKPLVDLPNKKIVLRELEFTDEERAVYDAYHQHAKTIIERYMKKGLNHLMKNYAHVFALMMRLRQLCCHRELLPLEWNKLNLDEIIEMATRQVQEDHDEEDDAKAKELAEQLRIMIRDGMTDECSICLSDMEHPCITPCAHCFCRPCITQYIDANPPPPAACPLCRGPLEKKNLLDAAVDEEEGNKDACYDDIFVESGSTKVDATLKELHRIRKECPGEKTIVVSQFTSLLSIVQPLLRDSGFNYTRLDGSMNTKERAKVIADFQDTDEDTPTVLLLSLRAGGVGLNLNTANHLILMDPAWNPSTEDQCFDRIHRLGQKRDVEIIRFIMRDTIENKMLDIQEKKKTMISGAFRQTDQERRQNRIQEIRNIFDIPNV